MSCSFVEEIMTLNKEMFIDIESDMAVWITTLGDPTPETAKINDTVKQTAGS
jgi:hypothetical protein